MNTDLIVLCYALFLYLGAFFGFKAGSKVSLIMGLASGTLILLGWFLIPAQPKAAYGFLCAVAAVLGVAFSMRLTKTKKFMPSGMLLGVTGLFLLIAIKQLISL